MNKLLTAFGLAVLFTMNSAAKVVLPDIISDNMVIQQNTKVRLWGRGNVNTTISVVASWNKKTFTTVSNDKGDWELWIETPCADYTLRQIEISDGEKLVIDNVLVGEVWLCSGQSNMEMPLKGFQNCPVEGGNESIATSGAWKNKIRFVTVPWTEKLIPQESCSGQWKCSLPENAQWFSAVGYYYAQMMNKVLDVPIGIISCSWGGSTIEGWLPERILTKYPDIDLSLAKEKKGMQCLRPMIMYNGMLHPLHRFTIKGFLWYQGESNVDKYNVYGERLQTMVRLWREEWNLGDLPFYYVEIAPYQYASHLKAQRFREEQFKAQFLIPNSGLISTNDLVEPYEQTNIHPKNKSEVGKRLAYMALSQTYAIKGIYSRGPEYKSHQVKNNKIILSFNHADDGFSRLEGIDGFEVAGSDRKFFRASVKALYDERKLEVFSENVKEPVAVRYCFHNFMPGNTANQMELPIVPFRTDSWE